MCKNSWQGKGAFEIYSVSLGWENVSLGDSKKSK